MAYLLVLLIIAAYIAAALALSAYTLAISGVTAESLDKLWSLIPASNSLKPHADRVLRFVESLLKWGSTGRASCITVLVVSIIVMAASFSPVAWDLSAGTPGNPSTLIVGVLGIAVASWALGRPSSAPMHTRPAATPQTNRAAGLPKRDVLDKIGISSDNPERDRLLIRIWLVIGFVAVLGVLLRYALVGMGLLVRH